jgi:hypothetical protein
MEENQDLKRSQFAPRRSRSFTDIYMLEKVAEQREEAEEKPLVLQLVAQWPRPAKKQKPAEANLAENLKASNTSSVAADIADSAARLDRQFSSTVPKNTDKDGEEPELELEHSDSINSVLGHWKILESKTKRDVPNMANGSESDEEADEIVDEDEMVEDFQASTDSLPSQNFDKGRNLRGQTSWSESRMEAIEITSFDANGHADFSFIGSSVSTKRDNSVLINHPNMKGEEGAGVTAKDDGSVADASEAESILDDTEHINTVKGEGLEADELFEEDGSFAESTESAVKEPDIRQSRNDSKDTRNSKEHNNMQRNLGRNESAPADYSFGAGMPSIQTYPVDAVPDEKAAEYGMRMSKEVDDATAEASEADSIIDDTEHLNAMQKARPGDDGPLDEDSFAGSESFENNQDDTKDPKPRPTHVTSSADGQTGSESRTELDSSESQPSYSFKASWAPAHTAHTEAIHGESAMHESWQGSMENECVVEGNLLDKVPGQGSVEAPMTRNAKEDAPADQDALRQQQQSQQDLKESCPSSPHQPLQDGQESFLRNSHFSPREGKEAYPHRPEDDEQYLRHQDDWLSGQQHNYCPTSDGHYSAASVGMHHRQSYRNSSRWDRLGTSNRHSPYGPPMYEDPRLSFRGDWSYSEWTRDSRLSVPKRILKQSQRGYHYEDHVVPRTGRESYSVDEDHSLKTMDGNDRIASSRKGSVRLSREVPSMDDGRGRLMSTSRRLSSSQKMGAAAATSALSIERQEESGNRKVRVSSCSDDLDHCIHGEAWVEQQPRRRAVATMYSRPDLLGLARRRRQRDIELMGGIPTFYDDHLYDCFDFIERPPDGPLPRLTADGEYDDDALLGPLQFRQWPGMPKIKNGEEGKECCFD